MRRKGALLPFLPSHLQLKQLHLSLKALDTSAPRGDVFVPRSGDHLVELGGCLGTLFRDPSVGTLYKHGSPYTYFSSAELHLGEISLECSRPGASAVALWATQQMFPLEKGGQFSGWLDDGLLAARDLWQKLRDSDGYTPVLEPELDIVVYAVTADRASDSSQKARTIFTRQRTGTCTSR